MWIPLPQGTGPFGYAFYSQSVPDIRHKIEKTIAGPQTPMSNFVQLVYLVFQ